jgi:hypothetical protein
MKAVEWWHKAQIKVMLRLQSFLRAAALARTAAGVRSFGLLVRFYEVEIVVVIPVMVPYPVAQVETGTGLVAALGRQVDKRSFGRLLTTLSHSRMAEQHLDWLGTDRLVASQLSRAVKRQFRRC